MIAYGGYTRGKYERQRSVNNSWSCILGTLVGDWLQIVINEVLAAFLGKIESETFPALSWKWASTECQGLLVMYLG